MDLSNIIDGVRRDLAKQQRLLPTGELRAMCETHQRNYRELIQALRRNDRNSGMPRIIAEIKKATPELGVLQADFQPLELAKNLCAAGAAALAVVTERNFFQGSGSMLSGISRLVKVPVIRQDFILDEYQILQACLWGADAVTLYVHGLDQADLINLIGTARRWRLTPIVRVDTVADLERAMSIPDIECIALSAELSGSAATLPEECVRLLYCEEKPLEASALDGVIIGTSLMQADDPAGELKRFLQ